VAGPPEDVLTARLVGGELDGMVVEIDAGVGTEDSEEGRQAVFELVVPAAGT
jgi:hypothetical protein